jgi:hypothetical protein
MQKGHISLIVVLILVTVIGIGSYYLGAQSQKSKDASELTTNLSSQPNASSEDLATFTGIGVNSGIKFKYPKDWFSDEVFISEKVPAPGIDKQTVTPNIIKVTKYTAPLYEGYTNLDWFNKVNSNQSLTDQRETRTKIVSGRAASGDEYVIFRDEGDGFKQVKAYILKKATIYQLTLDKYDDNGLEVLENILPTVTLSDNY